MGRHRVITSCAATAGLLSLAFAVPAIEIHTTRRARRPAVPGPHPLDGVVDADRPGTAMRCVWLGDSLSSGVGADHADDALPRQAAALLAADRNRPVELTVLAVPGAKVIDVLTWQLPEAKRLVDQADVIVVAVGANDVAHLTAPRAFRAMYRQVLTELAGRDVVCVGLPDMGSAVLLPQPARAIAGFAARNADRIVRSVVREFSASYVDISSRPSAVADVRVSDFLSADRYHPNGAGYAVWAGAVASVLAGVPGAVPVP